MGSHHKYPFKWVIVHKTKEFRINEHNKIKKKKIENLYFLPNNILTRLFKELKNIYKNDYR